MSAFAGRNDQPTRGAPNAPSNVVPFRRRVWETPGGLVITEARPVHPLGSPRGKWAYATGDDGDGLPRGVWCRFSEGRDISVDGVHWRLLGVLPHVVHVEDHPASPARWRLVFHLSLQATARPGDRAVAFASRGEIRSGRWSNRLGVALAGDPAVVRAVGKAILAEAQRAGFPVGDAG
ncbi:MAG TPA: hypothetical protein VHC18_06620 [Amycolatopsis sp.]|nr:hypothetical protein [Amycolatopsis sp.]